MLSQKIQNVSPSLTLAITAKAKQMKAQGENVLIFAAGEPDFNPPENVKNAVIKAVNDNWCRYTPVTGLPELKKLVCHKFKRDNNIDYAPEEIAVCTGGKQALYNAMQALLNPGDEVILPVPYWVSYKEQIVLADAKPVYVQTDDQFKVTAETVEKNLSPNTKMLIVNSPSNPSGAVCDEEELKKIAALAVEKDFWIISDEVYEYFIYDGKKHCSIASFSQEAKEKTITINAISKSFSATGWRLGYVGAPEEVIKGINKLQGHSTSNPCSLAQAAAIEAMKSDSSYVKEMVKAFDERRKFMVKRLNEMKGLNCNTPEGAFYCFPSVKETGLDSLQFCSRLLEEAKVALIPGIAFGQDENIRLSYATGLKEIKEGMERLEEWLNKQK